MDRRAGGRTRRLSLDVSCTPEEVGWRCTVGVAEGGTTTRHVVAVSRGELDRLTPGGSPEDLVRRSFEFLLEREPKESILRSFEISVIGRYFPEYERTIRAGSNIRDGG